jgi:protein TonB
VSEEITFPEGAAAPDSVPEAAAPEAAVPALAKEYPRRLVPDFLPSPVEPAPSLYGLGQNFIPDESTKEHEIREPLKKWLPLVAALLLVGGIVWLLLRPGGHPPANSANPAPATTTQAERPLGLYVDPAGPNWRVLWNPNATALRDARNVQLFVREKEDQNFIPLSERDRASGTYQYRPTGNDVTFRLEVTDKAGRVSAESFRVMQAQSAPVAAAPPIAPPPAPGATARITQPKAIYKAPPVIAAGIRPRIKGTIPIDVRVQIDARGHVVSATTVTKPHAGLNEYLAARAVQAARLWRFEPARENGKAVAATQILHFVFEK